MSESLLNVCFLKEIAISEVIFIYNKGYNDKIVN